MEAARSYSRRHVHQARSPGTYPGRGGRVGEEGGLGRAGRVGGASGRDNAVECVGQAFDLVHNITVMSLETKLAAERPDTPNTRVISKCAEHGMVGGSKILKDGVTAANSVGG